jgi:sec-independent protein translocase protein TatC
MVFLFKTIMSKISGKKLVDTIKNKGKSLEAEMSFFDHLEVLRWHLIRTAIALFIFMILAFSFYEFIFDNIIMGPRKTDFLTYQLLCKLGDWVNVPEFCITNIPGTLINTAMAGQFITQINSSLMIAVILGFPYLLYEIWLFIKPALTEVERKSASGFVFYATLLFVLGLCFGYFIVVPLSVNFLANYSISDAISNTITISNYLSFVSTLSFGCAIVFELPIVIYILSKIGLVTPHLLRNSRRYAIVIILILAALITPTADVITMLTVSAPMFLLYEISIIISNRVYKKRVKQGLVLLNDDENDNDK